jgi:hypothetical protein
MFVKKKTSESTLMHTIARTTVDKSDQIQTVMQIAADVELPSDPENFRNRVAELLRHLGNVCKRATLYFDESPYARRKKFIPELNATYTVYDRIDVIDCDGEKYYVHAEEEVYRTPEHEIIHSYRVKVVARS